MTVITPENKRRNFSCWLKDSLILLGSAHLVDIILSVNTVCALVYNVNVMNEYKRKLVI